MRTLIASLLLLLAFGGAALAKPAGSGVMPTKRDEDPEVGRRLYKQSCWECHGAEGKGDGPAAASLIGGVPSLEGKIKDPKDYDALVKVIEEGRGRMPAYQEDIDKHDARRILVFLDELLAGKSTMESTKKEAKEEEDDDNNKN